MGLLADNAGFGFIDLMLALVVLTIGVLALANLQTISSRSNTSSKRTTEAISLAEQKMEAIKNTVYANIAAEAPTQVTSSGLTFTREVQVTIDSPVANAKTVKVLVSWSDASGTHTIPMATIMAQ